MKLDNVKIGKKLGIGFGMLIFLMIILCALFIVNSKMTSSMLTRLITVDEPKIKYANDMKDAIDSITRSVAVMPFATQEIVEEEKNSILILRPKYKEAVEKLEKLLETQEEKDLLKRFKDAVTQGAEVNNKIIQLVNEGKKQEAQILYMNETRQTTMLLVEAANNIIRNQQKLLEEKVKRLVSYSNKLLIIILIVGAVSIIIGIFMSMKTTKSIKAPVEKAAEQLELMSKGDFTFSISQNAINRGDELGVIARAMDALNTNLKNVFNEIITSVHSLTSSATQLSSIAEEMSRTAESSSSRANSVATASEEMSQTVVDVAKNTASIAESAKRAVDTAQHGNSIVEKSVSEVREIDETVNESAKFVKSLGERSAHIGEIVSVINDIADQTNLLALNAAIEAARAGEQGRGFAVVADEVRKLAERTAQATSEIEDMIKAIQNEVTKAVDIMDSATTKVQSGVELTTQAGDALKAIVKSSDELQLMVQQIASATEEMSATSEQISKEIVDIANASRDTTASSQETAQAAVGLSRIATKLDETVRFFRLS
ncbi:MAG TPA: methyl-accepting chemotaxis protein [Syntrophorhabdaceae bacterium]|nr:methyl-accepting chemotaxis protein [Syntrophorhabdaceae bacterium]HPC66703.1 methyl-accepting chemotaxis protein [Syntrophorhabdaceae bacterium]HQH42198.1 methyl-accepting chemotaxis protein [Syntrophorhabdaceae bacterium]HRR71487.1 methyl-accepting chemotaxis protein [Syntrophorhabdaceae bacterium]HRV21430.1 methyl-accepting chemotaxis protein [Syntrophorhabdaceae bacterium]